MALYFNLEVLGNLLQLSVQENSVLYVTVASFFGVFLFISLLLLLLVLSFSKSQRFILLTGLIRRTQIPVRLSFGLCGNSR